MGKVTRKQAYVWKWVTRELLNHPHSTSPSNDWGACARTTSKTGRTSSAKRNFAIIPRLLHVIRLEKWMLTTLLELKWSEPFGDKNQKRKKRAPLSSSFVIDTITKQDENDCEMYTNEKYSWSSCKARKNFALLKYANDVLFSAVVLFLKLRLSHKQF